jgi:NAD dependent epimerase/dehydratase family enzyme
MSWVSLSDVVGAVSHLLQMESFSGPVNVVAPEPVRNREFTALLGRTLGRPTMLAVPAPALRLALGEMATATVLASARVSPRRLLAAGYHFEHPDLATALRQVLGSPTPG